MKTIKLLSIALATAALGACSSDDVTGTDSKGEGSTSYVAVNLQSTQATPTSAKHREDYQQPDADNLYEDGTEDEGKISDVRFYLFTQTGQPYEVNTTNYNYIDATAKNTNKDDHSQTIEDKSDVVLVIDGKTKTAPYYMVAVVNNSSLSEKLPDNTSLTLTQVKALVTKAGNTTDNKAFVMTNSAYYDNANPMCETNVTSYIRATKEEAENNPAEIYVERISSKVTVSATEGVLTDSKVKVGTIQAADGTTKDVYAKVLGWGLADENGKANVLKSLPTPSTNFTNADLGGVVWTSADYHRSFWEITPSIVADADANNYNPSVNHTFNDYKTALGTCLYTLPNTPTAVITDANNNDLTKVLVAAQLVDEDGNALEIARYIGGEYIGETAVLTAVASRYENKYYKKNADDSYTSLEPTDYDLVEYKGATATVKDYEVVAEVLNTVTPYKKDANGDFVVTTAADVNADLAAFPVQFRTSGYAYYYTPIRHLSPKADTKGYYGVVRNHAYRVSITGIAGFGTPVFNPDNVIDPQVPEDKNTYLAARINVLSWRVVKSDVNLDATK